MIKINSVTVEYTLENNYFRLYLQSLTSCKKKKKSINIRFDYITRVCDYLSFDPFSNLPKETTFNLNNEIIGIVTSIINKMTTVQQIDGQIHCIYPSNDEKKEVANYIKRSYLIFLNKQIQ